MSTVSSQSGVSQTKTQPATICPSQHLCLHKQDCLTDGSGRPRPRLHKEEGAFVGLVRRVCVLLSVAWKN